MIFGEDRPSFPEKRHAEIAPAEHVYTQQQTLQNITFVKTPSQIIIKIQ
jgi:hypothetical protein